MSFFLNRYLKITLKNVSENKHFFACFLHLMAEFLDQVSFKLVFIPCSNSASLCRSFSHSKEINTKLCDTGSKATNTNQAT